MDDQINEQQQNKPDGRPIFERMKQSPQEGHPDEQATNPHGYRNVMVKIRQDLADPILELYERQLSPEFDEKIPVRDEFKGRFIGKILEYTVSQVNRLKRQSKQLPPPRKAKNDYTLLWIGLTVGGVLIGIAVYLWMKYRKSE